MSIEATVDSINKATSKVSNETDAFKIDLEDANDCAKDNLIVAYSVYTVQCSVYTVLCAAVCFVPWRTIQIKTREVFSAPTA